MTRHYLVTGGAGFIGTHLVQRLLESGCRVSVIDDFSTGERWRVSDLAQSGRGRVIQGDVRDESRLKEALIGVDGIFHLAAKLSVQDSIKDWLGHHSVNSTALLRLFDLLHDVMRVPVVYASSAAIYGNRSDEMCHEDMAAEPISPYGADKLSCENHARAFWSVHGIPSFGLRFFNVYGPGQRPTSPYAGVLARFVQNIEIGKPPEIHGDGLQTRDFVYVSNVVDALVAAMDRISKKPDALVCNVCTGTSHSVRDIAYLIARILKAGPIRLLHCPERAGEIRHSRGDLSRMLSTLELGPIVGLEEGLSLWLSQQTAVSRVS